MNNGNDRDTRGQSGPARAYLGPYPIRGKTLAQVWPEQEAEAQGVLAARRIG